MRFLVMLPPLITSTAILSGVAYSALGMMGSAMVGLWVTAISLLVISRLTEGASP